MKFEKSADGYQQRDRYYKALRRRQRVLYDVTSAEPMIALEEPYIQGKVRSFKLSDRIAGLPESDDIEQALSYFSFNQYSRRGDFMDRRGKSKKLYPREMELRRISVYEVYRKRVPEHLLKYFVEYSGRSVSSYARLSELREQRYSRTLGFIYEKEVQIVTEDNWITHQRANLPEVDAELDRIEQIVEQSQVDSIFYGYGSVGWKRCENELHLRQLRRSDREMLREGIADYHDYQIENKTTSSKKGGDNSPPFSLAKILLLEAKKRLPFLRAA